MGTSAPAVAPPPAAAPQGQGGQSQSQPGATGQGQGGQQGTGGQQQGGDFWGMFPNVPEAQRELLQPHLTNIQGHVTQLEQRMAPYKGFMDSVPGDQVQGVQQFLQNWSADPLATWKGMAQSLVENGLIKSPGFSAEALESLINGQNPGFAPAQGVAQAAPGEQIPDWAQQMQTQLQTYQQQEQQRQQQAEAQQNEQILNEAHTGMREQLVAAGFSPEIVQGFTPQQLSAAIITNNGDVAQAVTSIVGMRDSLVGGFVQQNGQGARPATVTGDLNTPKSKVGKGRGTKDQFRQASLGAEQMLRQGAVANAQ